MLVLLWQRAFRSYTDREAIRAPQEVLPDIHLLLAWFSAAARRSYSAVLVCSWRNWPGTMLRTGLATSRLWQCPGRTAGVDRMIASVSGTGTA